MSMNECPNEMKWGTFDIALLSVTYMLPWRCFTFHSSATWGVFSHQTQNHLQGLSILQIPINAYCKRPIHTWGEWECRVTPGGLMNVHSTPSHCPRVRSPNSEICILVPSNIECPTLSIQIPPIQVQTILTVD